MELDITAIVANMFIGIGLGIGLVLLYVWWVIQRFHADLDGMVRETLDEVHANLVGVLVEEDRNQLFAYRDSDRQFLCQGDNIAEIRRKFNQQYPDKTAYLSGGDPALVERLRAELLQIKEQEKSENSISV